LSTALPWLARLLGVIGLDGEKIEQEARKIVATRRRGLASAGRVPHLRALAGGAGDRPAVGWEQKRAAAETMGLASEESGSHFTVRAARMGNQRAAVPD
jgi:hypothetical protein